MPARGREGVRVSMETLVAKGGGGGGGGAAVCLSVCVGCTCPVEVKGDV